MKPDLVAKKITNSSTLTCHCVLLLVVVQLLRSIQIQYQLISIENLMLLEHKMIPFFFRQIVWKRQIKHIACGVFAWKRYIGHGFMELVQKYWNNYLSFNFGWKQIMQTANSFSFGLNGTGWTWMSTRRRPASAASTPVRKTSSSLGQW